MDLVLNENNINEDSIVDKKSKVRALILTEDNEILVANYFGIVLLPGGKIDDNESEENALIRELIEELGVIYKKDEFEYLCTLNFYQANYPVKDGNIYNRKITTHYYKTFFKGIVDSIQRLSDPEKKGNFHLELLTFEELKRRLSQVNEENPRSEYFNQELNLIIDTYLELNKK